LLEAEQFPALPTEPSNDVRDRRDCKGNSMDGRRRQGAGRHRGSRGFSLVEALAVMAIVGVAMGISVPLVAARLKQAEIRAAANQFSVSLKAARMVAVSKRSPADVTVAAEPDNYYEYIDTEGRLRHFDLPTGVVITSSNSPITFETNGSVTGGATTVIEADLTGGTTERWTVTTSLLGLSTIAHEQIE